MARRQVLDLDLMAGWLLGWQEITGITQGITGITQGITGITQGIMGITQEITGIATGWLGRS